jgi:hypothetical protein
VLEVLRAAQDYSPGGPDIWIGDGSLADAADDAVPAMQAIVEVVKAAREFQNARVLSVSEHRAVAHIEQALANLDKEGS